jgi:hypothetical protein
MGTSYCEFDVVLVVVVVLAGAIVLDGAMALEGAIAFASAAGAVVVVLVVSVVVVLVDLSAGFEQAPTERAATAAEARKILRMVSEVIVPGPFFRLQAALRTRLPKVPEPPLCRSISPD